VAHFGPTFPAHIDKKYESELLNLSSWYKMISAKQWKNSLLDGIDDSQAMNLKRNTHTGRPLGSDGFISKLEGLLGRRIRPLPIGRPKKKVI